MLKHLSKLTAFILVQEMMLTFGAIWLNNSLGVKRLTHSTDTQPKILRKVKPQRTLWVVDDYYLKINTIQIHL
jgi:hypothetical protein